MSYGRLKWAIWVMLKRHDRRILDYANELVEMVQYQHYTWSQYLR